MSSAPNQGKPHVTSPLLAQDVRDPDVNHSHNNTNTTIHTHATIRTGHSHMRVSDDVRKRVKMYQILVFLLTFFSYVGFHTTRKAFTKCVCVLCVCVCVCVSVCMARIYVCIHV